MLVVEIGKALHAVKCLTTSNDYSDEARKQIVRKIGRFLNRSHGTISRNLDSDLMFESGYVASLAAYQARNLRNKPRKQLKPIVGGALFGVVVGHLKKKWSPEPIAGTFMGMHPDEISQRVSYATIYHTLYAMPRGELRRELIA